MNNREKVERQQATMAITNCVHNNILPNTFSPDYVTKIDEISQIVKAEKARLMKKQRNQRYYQRIKEAKNRR